MSKLKQRRCHTSKSIVLGISLNILTHSDCLFDWFCLMFCFVCVFVYSAFICLPVPIKYKYVNPSYGFYSENLILRKHPEHVM